MTTTQSPRRTSLLPSTWDVPDRFRQRLGNQVGRQRAMYEQDHLLLVLHAPPEPDDPARHPRFFWRQPNGTWKSSEFGGGAGGLDRQLGEYAAVIEGFDHAVESARTADEYFQVVGGLAPVDRAVRNLYEVLREARKLVPDDRQLIDFRDRAYELQRTSELVHKAATSGLDFAVAERAEAQAKSSQQMAVAAHRLNLLAAFFFPIATLTAVFGTNLQHGLEKLPPPIPFLSVLGVGLICGAILTLFVTRR